MRRFGSLFAGLAGLVIVGCMAPEAKTRLVPPNLFDVTAAPPPPTKTYASPASTELAARVDTVGRKILDANPQIGVKPLFRTVGSPQAELFHRGTVEIIVTEGLVKQCPDEGKLAAVLCHELGKMISERESLTAPQTRLPDRPPPINVPVGNDGSNLLGTPDQTHLAEMELARFGREGRRPARTAPPPDPNALAHVYLRQAGYSENDLASVAVLLQNADLQGGLEKQWLAAPPLTPVGR